MYRHLFLLILSISILSCAKHKTTERPVKELTSYVNPLIGTKNMGHTFPGATAPFGMVQLSPETNLVLMYNNDGSYNKETYRYCSGYQYEDSTIFGFTHTHFSGTGHSDLGDILIMPTTGKLITEPGKISESGSGWYSYFSHNNEQASPGYYSVKLSSYNINARLTASERTGFHQYSFPHTDSAHIILDLTSNIYNYDGKNVWTFLRVENDTLVTGYRITSGWARTRTVYFAITFSQPIENYGILNLKKLPYNGFYRKFDEDHNFPERAGKEIRAYFDFSTMEDTLIMLKVALSPVSTNGAINNLKAEIPGWDFEKTYANTQSKWNKELSKIDVEMQDRNHMEAFYTALYHTMLSPIIYEDTDGSYRGLDQNIYTSDGFTNYTIFSLWDTYRALHPLLNLIEPSRNSDMMHSMMAHQNQSVHKALPVWSHYANENWCMVGYHSVSALADAIVNGTTDINPAEALKAAVSSSNVTYYDGIGDYVKMGYVPEDHSGSSVSKTLEYAYDDWCIAQIALAAGDSNTYNTYKKRSESYRNVYNKQSGYMQPKLSDGSWRSNFDPLDTHGQGFIEGNAWNYGLYVPHSIDTMITMMGGKNTFSAHLDKIFTTEIDDKYIEKNEDITRDGIIGNYVHGNEPGHHIPYLYNFTNDPHKTQERVRMIMETMYTNDIDGLCGNDDAGQMSAWYIFSSLGFYPVLPGSGEYALGSPLVKKATIYLENGKTFTVNTKNQSPENIYVKNITLNGTEHNSLTLSYKDIMKGGNIVFTMSKGQ